MHLWVLGLCVGLCAAHVSLLYPPSRQPSLDFYSTLNSNPPCGVPKPPGGKGVHTYLKAGSEVNVEWFTAIPHMGGIRLEVLNSLDQPIAIFTNFLDAYNVSDSRKKIALPANFECENCALRLTHQATEYGPDYQFYTCADVNILNEIPDGDSCLGRGERIDGECLCDNGHYGSECQYTTECATASKCGSGKCVESAQSQQCYCEPGHFGAHCERESTELPATSDAFDPTLYSVREAEGNKIYWRIIKDEIEFVLKFPGHSWAGVGWKPKGYVCPTPVPQPPLYEHKKVHFKKAEEKIDLKPVHVQNTQEKTTASTTEESPELKQKQLEIESEESEEIFTTNTFPTSTKGTKGTTATSTTVKPSTTKSVETTPEGTTGRSVADKDEATTQEHVDSVESETTKKPTTTRTSSTTNTEVTTVAGKETESTAESDEWSEEEEGEPERTTSTAGSTTMSSTMSTTTSKTITTTAAEIIVNEVSEKKKLREQENTIEVKNGTTTGGCGKNEQLSDCPEMSRECEASCDWTRFPETIPNCPRACGEPRCVCKEGFVRQSNDDNNCVPFDFCSAEEEPVCPSNSTWAKCGIACEPSCANMYDTSPCPASCEEPACTCADNYVRFEGRCIYWGDCPNLDEAIEHMDEDSSEVTSAAVSAEVSVVSTASSTAATKKKDLKPAQTVCPVNETMTECGTACEADCVTIFTRPPCDNCGESACSCIQGYARSNGICVYWGDCPPTSQQQTTRKPTTPKETVKSSEQNAQDDVTGEQCYGDYRYPPGCKDCDYKLSWNYVDETDEIEFSLETKIPQNWWTGVGISSGGSMVDADMIIVKSENGKLSLLDMYSSSYGVPTLDASQDVYTPTAIGSHANGVLRAQFTRKRSTGDKTGDNMFSDTQCMHMLFPVEGGRLDDNGNITIHMSTPKVSESKVCIRSCIADTGAKQSDGVCENEFRSPASCVDTACDYIAKWEYDADRHDVKFEISSKELGRWTGIGFSKDGQMSNADIYTGWIYEGKAYVTDRFAYARQLPAIDPADRTDIYEIGGRQEDELQTITFRRPLVPKDQITDLPLDECYYFLFPVGGGRVLARKSSDFTNPRTPIGYHDLFQPRVSKTKICICDAQGKRATPQRRRAKRSIPVPHRIRNRRAVAQGGAVSAMACTDMVVGMVHEGKGRVRDMFSPSKATPQMDSFFSGKDDLTAASAYQVDGITTVVFRKKLNAVHLSDHSIVPGPMTVIWAKGADPNNYQHTTGGATIRADPAFFGREFKYHGKNQRGVMTIDFFGTTDSSSSTSSEKSMEAIPINIPTTRMPHIPDLTSTTEGTKSCSGMFTYPKGCVASQCLYAVGWMAENTVVSFHIEARMKPNTWTAVGFSPDGGMAGTDAIIVSLMDNEISVTDNFLPNYGHPTVDEQQDVFDVTTAQRDGRVYANFSRNLRTEDLNDVSLDTCQFLVFTPTGGDLTNSGQVKKHKDVPTTSPTKICLNVCTVPASGSTDVVSDGKDTEEHKETEKTGAEWETETEEEEEPTEMETTQTTAARTTAGTTTMAPETPKSTKMPPKTKSGDSSGEVLMPPMIKAGPSLFTPNPNAKKRYGLRVRILNRDWDSALADPQSEYYQSFTKQVSSAINDLLAKKWKGMSVSKIVEYTKGSVIVEFEVDATEDLPKEAEVKTHIENDALSGRMPGGFAIEPSTVNVRPVEIPREPMDDTMLFGLNLDKELVRNVVIIAVAALVLLFAVCCTCCLLCKVRRTSNQFSPMRTESMEAKSYSDIPYKAESGPFPYPAAYGPYGTLTPNKGFENKAYQGQAPTGPGAHQRHFSQATTASNKGGSSSPAPSGGERMPDGMGETTYQEWYTKVASKSAAQQHEESVQPPPPRPPSAQPYVSYPNDPATYYTLGGEHRASQQQQRPYFRPPY